MKKLILLIGLVLLVAFLSYGSIELLKNKISNDLKSSKFQNSTEEKNKNYPSNKKEVNSVFVPYWSLNNNNINEEGVDEYVYFGLAVNAYGIDKEDEGYNSIKDFISKTPYDKNKHLAIRMLDNSQNIKILEDKNLQKRIINESIRIAKENEFDGIVLDLELKAIPFDSLVKSIDDFVKEYNSSSEKENMKFQVLAYGDTFYRLRPFNIKNIGENSDGIIIMAYDFHKAGGNPGPNFPLSGSKDYGYDMSEMINDFLDNVPADKLTVAFGLYGYDWPLGKDNNSIAQATSMSLNKINQDFVFSCKYSSCNKSRDELSAESKIEYIGENDQKHVIWYEDFESMEKKRKFLTENGINKFSKWAYTYY